MVKAKKGKNKKPSSTTTTTTTTGGSSTSTSTTNPQGTGTATNVADTTTTTPSPTTHASVSATATTPVTKNWNTNNKNASRKEDLDDLYWLRECELRQSSTGDPLIQLEYNDDDELMMILYRFLEESSANSEVIDAIYQIWQQTVLSTLLQSSAIWKKETVTERDQKTMKDTLKISRLKINFIIHHVIGNILTSNMKKWVTIRDRVIDMCYNTLQLLPRLAESCQHHPTDLRLVIIHYEGKEFLANVACETWDTLYDYSIPIDIHRFVPVLRRCAMLDILDRDWNMLGGWDDILCGIETKCCGNNTNGSNPSVIQRLPSDYILHEMTTILRNARNSMQCKFFSVRFMRYTDDQAPQRYKYYPKCTAPACSNIETPHHIHPYRCRKCWYFHYCSASCQEYCENIVGLHSKFCTDTPKVKALTCQKETEQYLGFQIGALLDSTAGMNNNSNDDDDDFVVLSKMVAKTVITCHACGVPEDNLLKSTSSSSSSAKGSTSSSSLAWHNMIKMKRCVQCQSVSYCSRQCQEWDWKVGRHRDICKLINTSSTLVNTNTSSSTSNTAATSANRNPNRTTTSTITTTTTATSSSTAVGISGGTISSSAIPKAATATTHIQDLN